MAKVSIIVPVYNVEKYIKRSLDSLINQTFSDIEIIVINDGSTDNSLNIIETFKDERIRLYSQDNKGGSAARNLGVDKSTSDYIMFLDADDYYHLDCVEKAYKCITEENTDICIYGSRFVDDEGNYTKSIIPNHGTIKNISDDKSYLLNIENCTWDKIYKSSIIKDNNVLYPYGLYYQDFGFTFSLMRFVKSISFVNEELIEYTVGRSGNITGDVSKKVFDIFKIIDFIKDLYIDKKIYDDYFDELKSVFLINIIDKLKQVVRSKNSDIKEEFIDTYFNYIEKELGGFDTKYKISKHKHDFVYLDKNILKLYMFIKRC